MSNQSHCLIGQPGIPWGEKERLEWRAQTQIKREYQTEVVPKIQKLAHHFTLTQYGALSYDTERYPLFCLKTNHWDDNKPTVFITGGVHGYETSGVHGALQFLEQYGQQYEAHFNIVAAPCVSPWGYETINRWNPNALDPNRNFVNNSEAEESAALLKLVASLPQPVLVHMDLHETTDTDETEFRPALAARDGIEYEPGLIPDGFYTVGDSANPQLAFQNAIIESVRQVTHIAPADENNEIIGSPVVADGVILYDLKTLGLCGGITNCQYSSTTEVYPDSPTVTDQECNEAQVAAVKGALDYVLSQRQ